MDLNDIEKKLSNYRSMSTDELPEVVRKGMDDAFRELSNMPVQRRRKWKYAWGAAAAAFVLFFGVLSSAFVSPVMAKSLRGVPFFEDIFKLTHHMGLQTAEERGMMEEPNLSVTHHGVTLRIPKLVYTGSNIYFVLEQDTEDHRFNNRGYSVSGKVNGEIVDMYVSQGVMKNWGRTDSAAAAIVTISHADYSSKDGTPYRFPDEFTLNLEIGLVGMDQERFVFNIPVKKNENETKIITSDAPPKEWREFKISLGRIEITPVMIRLTMNEDYSKQDLTKRRERLRYILEDQDGNRIEADRGGFGRGIPGTKVTAMNMDMDPFERMPTQITILPYLYSHETRQKMIIPELAITVPVSE